MKKDFSDNQKLRKFVVSRPALQKVLKEVPSREGREYGWGTYDGH